jgi:hypothetical protein
MQDDKQGPAVGVKPVFIPIYSSGLLLNSLCVFYLNQNIITIQSTLFSVSLGKELTQAFF